MTMRLAFVAALTALVGALTAVTLVTNRHPPNSVEGPVSTAVSAVSGVEGPVPSAVSEGGGVEGPMSRAEARARAHALTALGARMFADASLSASGRVSCVTCHDPAHAFAPANAQAVQIGGATTPRPGHRAVPSLKYLQAVPPFTEHFFESESEGDSSIDNGPTGGLTWDGRVDRPSGQARLPLLSPFEMANATATDIAVRVGRASYTTEVARLFGEGSLHDPDAALRAVGLALEAYLEDPQTFYPYNSKYDAYLDHRATLTDAERRGLAAFEDPQRGNCASCHRSRRSPDGAAPQFTDYGLVALGVPRNAEIPANADPAHFDLGLCGPDRTTFTGRASYCGRFMTPTLRNVATRSAFFHNGVFHDLRTAVEFYAERDAHPDRFYSRGPDGRVRKFDDLPEPYWSNVETGAPFGGGHLSEQDVDDVVAFLRTLTDGYRSR